MLGAFSFVSSNTLVSSAYWLEPPKEVTWIDQRSLLISFFCFSFVKFVKLLPPAYVVRGKVLFSQVSVCPHLGGGTHPADGGGTPFPGLDGGYPIQLTGPRPRWGVPHPRSSGGVPPQQGVNPPPPPDQHSVYLLCGRRYASCVHAGGLSCLNIGFLF